MNGEIDEKPKNGLVKDKLQGIQDRIKGDLYVPLPKQPIVHTASSSPTILRWKKVQKIQKINPLTKSKPGTGSVRDRANEYEKIIRDNGKDSRGTKTVIRQKVTKVTTNSKLTYIPNSKSVNSKPISSSNSKSVSGSSSEPASVSNSATTNEQLSDQVMDRSLPVKNRTRQLETLANTDRADKDRPPSSSSNRTQNPAKASLNQSLSGNSIPKPTQNTSPSTVAGKTGSKQNANQQTTPQSSPGKVASNQPPAGSQSQLKPQPKPDTQAQNQPPTTQSQPQNQSKPQPQQQSEPKPQPLPQTLPQPLLQPQQQTKPQPHPQQQSIPQPQSPQQTKPKAPVRFRIEVPPPQASIKSVNFVFPSKR